MAYSAAVTIDSTPPQLFQDRIQRENFYITPIAPGIFQWVDVFADQDSGVCHNFFWF